MSLVPEYILQTTIVRGIKAMRNDTRLLDQLFRNLDQATQAAIRQFVQTQAVDLRLGYPREVLTLPAIVILLKAESEAQAYLGDSMGTGFPEEFSYEGDIGEDLLGGTASVSSITGQGTIVFGPYTAFSGTLNTLNIATAEWSTGEFAGRDLTISIVGGKGSGQTRSISTNGPKTVMVSTNWTTVPDNTSIFEIRSPLDEIVGEPSKLYDRRDTSLTIERKGSLYSLAYQVQVIGPNPEATIFLTIILKAIFTLARTFLERQGIINLKMSASDLTPKTEYQPDFAYTRVLNLDFMFPFDVFEDLGTLAKQFTLALEADCGHDDIADITTSFTLGRTEPKVGP